MAISDWDLQTLQSRILNEGCHRRHAGGSPDENEIAAYAAALPSHGGSGTALILGMTPELRRLALRRYRSIISVDINPQAIELYRGWVDSSERRRERIIQGDWMDLPHLVDEPVLAVLGDGIFGNLSGLTASRRLLQRIAPVLAKDGRFVTRHALIPNGFEPAAHRAEILLRKFRRGKIDAAEFGFGTRLVGHYESCYDPSTFLLDNARVFRKCDEAHQRGALSETELRAIRRYYFAGSNCIMPQARWEELLDECGYGFTTHACRGKSWYYYYVVYSCRLDV